MLVLFINSSLSYTEQSLFVKSTTMSTPQCILRDTLLNALFRDNYNQSIHDVLSNTGPLFLSQVYNALSTSIKWKEVALVWLCSLALYGKEKVRMTARNALVHDCGHHIYTDAYIERLRDSICDRVMTDKNKVFLTMLKALGNVVFCMDNRPEFEESVFQFRGFFMLYTLSKTFTVSEPSQFLVSYAQSLLEIIGKNKEFVPYIRFMIEVLEHKKIQVRLRLELTFYQEMHEDYCKLVEVSEPHPEVAMIQRCIDLTWFRPNFL